MGAMVNPRNMTFQPFVSQPGHTTAPFQAGTWIPLVWGSEKKFMSAWSALSGSAQKDEANKNRSLKASFFSWSLACLCLVLANTAIITRSEHAVLTLPLFHMWCLREE